MQNNNLKKAILTAVCIALCIVFPMAFHAIPNAGPLLSPMHAPVFLCGLICGPFFGLLCGVLGPVLSSVITGMPPSFILPGMTVELAAYGLIVGLVFLLVRTGKELPDLIISMLLAILGGRIVVGICNALIFKAGEYSFQAWTTSYFVKGWPSILFNIILVPIVYLILDRAKLIDQRY